MGGPHSLGTLNVKICANIDIAHDKEERWLACLMPSSLWPSGLPDLANKPAIFI